jgi:hypothetical protein
MKQMKIHILAIAAMASVFIPLQNANAWVVTGHDGGRGFVAGGGYYYGGHHGGGYYRGGGCYGCGAAAGAVAGLAVGTMVGAAISSSERPATVIVQQPEAVVVQQPAYYAQGSFPIGTQFVSLPPGSNSIVVRGVNYYQSGPNWYKPYFGSSGVYYEVVPAP